MSPLEYETTVKILLFLFVSPVQVDVVVPMLLTELKVHFSLELMENPVRVVAPAECHMDVLVSLFNNCWLDQTY